MINLVAAIAKAGGSLLAKAVPKSAKILKDVAQAFGVESDDPDVVALAIERDPDAAVKILELQKMKDVELRALDVAEEQVHQKDRASAREREKFITQVTGNRDTMLYILAFIVVAQIPLLLGFHTFVGLPDNAHTGALVSGVIAAALTVLNYFFGSAKKGNSNDQVGGE